MSDRSPKTENLQKFINGLHDFFDGDHVNIEELKHYMGSYDLKDEDWREKMVFAEKRYTRILIDAGNGKFNLILLCWGEGQGSAIHDHSNSHCVMRIMDGCLKETLYPCRQEGDNTAMVPIAESKDAKPGDVLYINDTIGLHRVGNETKSKAVSLHLYSPPFQTCHSFDENNGQKKVCPVTFY